jgi:hypothetical protein
MWGGRNDGRGRVWHGNCTGTAVLAITALALVIGITALAMPWLCPGRKMSDAAIGRVASRRYKLSVGDRPAC